MTRPQTEKTIRNNPQLVEVQLFAPPQAALDILDLVAGDSLQYLFINGPKDTLSVGNFPSLVLLSINSDSITNLNTISSVFNNLVILDIVAPQLKVWNSKSNLPLVQVVHLIAPALNLFPITSAPNLFQMDYTCPFDEIPTYLCGCNDLTLISFNNTKNIIVNECFIKKLETAHYSNITIYETLDGKIIMVDEI